MLVPRRVFAGLRCQLQGMLGFLFRLAQQHPAAGGSDNFIAVEGKRAELAKGAALLAVVCRTQRLGGIFDQGNVVLTADSSNLIQLGRVAV